MERVAPWLLRIGALLMIVSPLLPQAEGGARRYGVPGIRRDLADNATGIEVLAIGVGLLLPAVAALGLLLGSTERGRALLRIPMLGLLLFLCFALSTLGSLVLSTSGGPSRPGLPGFGLSLALFLVPLVLAGVAVARGLEKGLRDAPDLLEQLSFAALLGLQGLFLVDAGWTLLVGMTGAAGPVRILPGAAVEPFGALLVAAGAILSSATPRAAVDSAPASG